MKGIYLIPSLAIFLSYVSSVHGASPAWGQCGGINYTGDTTCVSGYGCVKVNDCEFDLLFMEFFWFANKIIPRLLPVSARRRYSHAYAYYYSASHHQASDGDSSF